MAATLAYPLVATDTVEATGTNSSTAAQLIQQAPTTVYVVTNAFTSYAGVLLPTNANPGDSLELYTDGTPFSLYSGPESIFGATPNDLGVLNINITLRKTTTGWWANKT